MVRQDVATAEQLKVTFRSLDKNGDGCLDLQELSDLLKSKDQTMSERQVQYLFDSVDKNGDGVVQFDEFVDYIYGIQSEINRRTTSGRRASLRQSNAITDEGDAELWPEVQQIFNSFFGNDCDGKDFVKLCKDCRIINKHFLIADCDLIFGSSVLRGQRRMSFEEFQVACCRIAQKKGCPVREVQQSIIGAGGVRYTGTVAENVRFHDDKSTYTGAHNHRFDLEPAIDQTIAKRQERLRKTSVVYDFGDASAWEDCKEVFKAFVGKDCDGKEFAKMCKDCLLLDKNFTATDCDVIFAGSVPQGQRRMQFDDFRKACGKIAARKCLKVAEIQGALISAGGPRFKGTVPDKVRFHDDKSTYTGAHIERCNAVGAMERVSSERHERLRKDSDALDLGDESLWKYVNNVYDSFVEANRHQECDGRVFAKLCRDCNLYNAKFTSHDADVIFSSCASGSRRMDFEQFKIACAKIAAKKRIPANAVQREILDSEGPKFRATKSDDVRFHDDKSTYTGIHYGK